MMMSWTSNPRIRGLHCFRDCLLEMMVQLQKDAPYLYAGEFPTPSRGVLSGNAGGGSHVSSHLRGSLSKAMYAATPKGVELVWSVPKLGVGQC